MNCCGSTGTNAIEVTLKLARKNSLHFGSDEGAESAAVYHSLISTVKLQGRFAWDYLGKFFTGIFSGCRDFLSLTSPNIDSVVCQ